MSQEQRNRGGEQRPGRAGYDRELQRLEGFEGMNYEQPRPPYQQRPGKDAAPKNDEPASGDKQDA